MVWRNEKPVIDVDPRSRAQYTIEAIPEDPSQDTAQVEWALAASAWARRLAEVPLLTKKRPIRGDKKEWKII